MEVKHRTTATRQGKHNRRDATGQSNKRRQRNHSRQIEEFPSHIKKLTDIFGDGIVERRFDYVNLAV